jgi:hypothetical protein
MAFPHRFVFFFQWVDHHLCLTGGEISLLQSQMIQMFLASLLGGTYQPLLKNDGVKVTWDDGIPN